MKYFITNQDMNQIFNIRMKISNKCNEFELKSITKNNNDIFNKIIQLLDQKDLVKIQQEDMWTKHFRESKLYT